MAGFKVSILLREEEENALAFFLLHRSVESRDGGVGGARVDCRQHLASGLSGIEQDSGALVP